MDLWILSLFDTTWPEDALEKIDRRPNDAPGERKTGKLSGRVKADATCVCSTRANENRGESKSLGIRPDHQLSLPYKAAMGLECCWLGCSVTPSLYR